MPEQLKTLPSLAHAQSPGGRLRSCLSEEEILSFVQGEVPSDKLDPLLAHMDECDECQCLVAEAAHAVDAEPMSESVRPSWNTVFQHGTIVGKRYRVVRLIARGGMGEVYEAHDMALHERIAIKTVTSTACDSAQAMRHLRAEVQLARRISHPNVCRIYDIGSHVMEPSGAEIQFLVMEYVEGECLGKKLRVSGALPLDLAQSTARQLLLGLRAAHQAGILHRDFKSENVMLRTDSGGQVTPVILDFGLAKALNESGRTATTQNQGQAMVGTIGYMAPEQIEGQPLSCASDIYAFGVVLFEMLTGRLPFEGASPAASALARLQRAAEPPSSINAEIPQWLDEIVLRCLSRQRAARYESAEQVLNGLSTAATASPPAVSPTRIKTKPRLALAGIALLVAVTTGSFVQWRARSELRSEALELRPGLPSIPPTWIQAATTQIDSSPALPGPAATLVDAATNGKPVVSTPRAVSIGGTRRTKSTPRVETSSKQGASPAPTAEAPTAHPVTPPSPAKRRPDWLPLKSEAAATRPLQVAE
jgi:serine/threonine protein kinase